MDAVRILQNPPEVSWDYDEEADVLYVSVGKPQPALGVDIGDGVILRYSETRNAVVGLTLIGLRARLQDEQQHPSGIDPSQRLIQAAEETKALLNQLSQVYSSVAIVGAKAIEEIECNSVLKAQIVNALKVGGMTTFETLVDHPAVGIITAAVKGEL
ncbi:DUF2283 domain-containing protein [Egbenema bharatensis]|uniref:DUF2283 domain-containing protein n=1 Tax=Egbenema bharatensis TaxID=3463334 RepID=UPI003A8678AC